MKNPVLFGLVAIFYFNCYGQDDIDLTEIAGHNEKVYMQKIIKNYFRSDPYQNGFGWFLKHLLNDPILINKEINKRTDSGFFSFRGQYKNYSPFSFLADSTEIKLMEKEFAAGDTLSLKDTLFVYQLEGYSRGKSAAGAVEKEFSKFNRRFGKNFSTQSSPIKNGTRITGVVQDYYIPGVQGSPMSVGWIELDEYSSVFSIAIRLKISRN